MKILLKCASGFNWKMKNLFLAVYDMYARVVFFFCFVCLFVCLFLLLLLLFVLFCFVFFIFVQYFEYFNNFVVDHWVLAFV